MCLRACARLCLHVRARERERERKERGTNGLGTYSSDVSVREILRPVWAPCALRSSARLSGLESVHVQWEGCAFLQ